MPVLGTNWLQISEPLQQKVGSKGPQNGDNFWCRFLGVRGKIVTETINSSINAPLWSYTHFLHTQKTALYPSLNTYQRIHQGRIGTHNFVVPGLSQLLF